MRLQMMTKKTTKPKDQIAIEPGFEKRLASIYKKALNKPPTHRSTASTKRGERKAPKDGTT